LWGVTPFSPGEFLSEYKALQARRQYLKWYKSCEVHAHQLLHIKELDGGKTRRKETTGKTKK
jgi:hypothetical protein